VSLLLVNDSKEKDSGANKIHGVTSASTTGNHNSFGRP
jgi:hypothetical protein